jgi:hypothetical protein
MAMEEVCGCVHSHLDGRNSVTVNRSRVDGREQKQHGLWGISDEARMKRLECLHSMVLMYASMVTPNSKQVKHKVMGENNKWTAMGRIRNQAVQLRGRGGPKRLSGVSGRGIIHPEKSSLRSPNVPIFDEGSNSKAHILSKINPFSSKNGLQQNTNRMNSI